jgi:long-chain acyl-CoA synthetase
MSLRLGDDGEVQLRGPLIMAGYHHLPDKTTEAMTDDGWLRTGDSGSIDDDGFLSITGRMKELFKTSGGKYVAPPAIEAKFMSLCPYASQFLVFGEGHNFCVALITLDADAITGWAADHGLADASYQQLVESPELRRMFDEYVEKLNADLNRWEAIKKWELLDRELSVESGELTPSLKVKRSVVAEHNKKILDAFYT